VPTYIAEVREPERGPETEILDHALGRREDPATLLARVATAPAGYLEGALDNPSISPDIVALILRQRTATAPVVAKIGRHRAWMRHREVRVALVANPLAPAIVAWQVLPHLRWGDLANVVCDPRLAPPLRKEAEKLLRTRLPDLAIGERAALARRPGRGIVEVLRGDENGSVLQALAGNSAATSSDVLAILARLDAPRDFLSWLSASSSWGQRRDVVYAVVRHPNTPRAAALRLMRSLTVEELARLGSDPSASRLVRVAAERRLHPAPALRSRSEDGVG
jgi:hypothetical protein